MLVALAALTARLVDLQAVGGDKYDTLARDQLIHPITLSATRGSIFDRNGHELALSVPRPTIFADGGLIRDPAKTAAAIGPLLGLSVPELTADLDRPSVHFMYLARRISPAVAKQVAELGLPGIAQVTESQRVYPAGSLAAPVLGFVGSENQGLGGLEEKYTGALAGTPGSLEAERDPTGREIPATERRVVPAERGNDLVLTLDQSLQYVAEQRLTEEVNAVGAKAGMAVIVDVHSGDVLAMVNVNGAVGSTPAHPATARDRNRPLTDIYEPGSTAKVITASSALEAGVITTDTQFSVASSVEVGGKAFNDDEEHDVMNWTVLDILTHSSNVGAIAIADRVERAPLDRAMRSFGFGARTPIRFPGEASGVLQAPSNYDPAIMGSMPIGYGIATTAMQTLDVFTTVAAGGVNRPPRLVSALIDADGRRTPTPAPARRRVISQATAASMRDILANVVTSGTGKRAAIDGYSVAGKTGTSRKPPYEPPYHYMASFAGFAPAESPRFAAVVVLDDPQSATHGGEVAAPVFSAIMQYALHLYHVPTTEPAPTAATQSTSAGRGPTGNVSAPAP